LIVPRLPPQADIAFNEAGLILAPGFEDSYFSAQNGLEESRAVFLAGCDLPRAWEGRAHYVIGELGFGTGLNALATLELWRRTRTPGAVLHFVSVEGFLMSREEAAKALAAFPGLGPLADKLLARWPVRAAGVQRIWLEEESFALTLLVGEAEAMLPRAAFTADCWFLDGFAPARNQSMWSPAVLGQVARLSKTGTRAATYSVAGAVRRGLSEVGFEVTRAPGFGHKRERLEARFAGKPEGVTGTPPRPETALVIGGGIAGAAMAHALARRGVQVTVLDDDGCGRTKASANPAALIMPRLDRGDTREARFLRAAYVHAVQTLQSLGPLAFEQTGVVEYARPGGDPARLADLAADPPLPPEWLTPLDDGRLLHPKGGLAFPHEVRRALLSKAQVLPVKAARLTRSESGSWQALDEGGPDEGSKVVGEADVCIVAAGPMINTLCEDSFPLDGRLGQITLCETGMKPLPPQPISGAAYAARFENWLMAGATFDIWPLEQPPSPVSAEAHLRNQTLLAGIAPDLARTMAMDTAWGRTSVRACTPDRLPMAGGTRREGLFVLGGLGSRGFTTSFLCAELIAALLLDEPLPMEDDLARALAPGRFAERAARRQPSKRATS
jgi:tRNA 5-methylaminomethyl-2-thiouridine biosynthesis bifunctional protein